MGPYNMMGGGCRHLRIGLRPDPPSHEGLSYTPEVDRDKGSTLTQSNSGGESAFPREYKDLQDVFSERE